MELGTRLGLAAVFLVVALVFVWRSFYRMRIESPVKVVHPASTPRAVHEHG
jgi:K(+)-stimulated pyrophosphate-energized sodium pump